MLKHLSITWLFILGVSVLTLTKTTWIVYADGDDESLIHACVKSGGGVRIVGPDDLCKSSETSTHWGITGPQGEPGTPADTTVTDSLQTQIDDLQAQVDALGGGGLFTTGTGGSVVADGRVEYFGLTRFEINEVAAQLPIPRDGELFALAVFPRRNDLTGIATFTVRLNGADTNLQINVPAGSTAVHTIESVVNVSAGDLVALEIDTEAGGERYLVRCNL